MILSRLVPGSRQIFLKKFIQVLRQEMIPLEIVSPSGEVFSTTGEDTRHRLMIRDNRFFNALVSPNAFSLGEAYVKGYFDISGNIRELYEMVCEKLLDTDQPRWVSAFFAGLAGRILMPPREREKKNIQYHYDVPKEFYRIFLGETMGYTCGYYPTKEATMSEAQNEKMEIICKKLRLKAGEHLLDIGCGWGNFVIYAAKHYGVTATGITLSAEQQDYAMAWIKKENLQDVIQIRMLNYRDLSGPRYDKISCIGMSEHVGQDQMKGFFAKVYGCLKEGGLFLQHSITTYTPHKKGHANKFLDTYMFPGGELMRQPDLVDLASDCGFELLTAENFRPHYVRTLKDWISRMESRKEKLLSLVSEDVFRIYHVFFIGSMISFRQREIALFQNLFYKSAKEHWDPEYFLTPYADNEAPPSRHT